MRIRTFLLTSAAGIGFLFASANIVPAAYAQKGSFLTAQTQWAVTKVNGDAGQGQQYCAVARRFEQDMVLTIAQNPSDEASFALDFQKFKFDPTRSLSITLDPGAGEQRVYEVKPLSAKAFVVKLGRDDAFFRALQTTGFLRVEAANQSYVFNIADVDAGQAKLGSCLDSLGRKAVREADGGADAAIVEALESRIQSLETQNEALLAKARAAENAKVQAPDVSAMASKIEVLRSENERLKLALKDQELSSKHTDVLEKQVESLRSSNEALQAELKGKNPSGMEEEYAQRIAAIKAENEKLQGRVKELLEKSESSDLDAKEMAALKDQNDTLNERLAAVKQEAQTYQSTEIERLSAENQGLKAQLGDYKEMVVLVETLRERIASLETQNAALRDSLAESDALKAKVASLQDKIVTLESQNEELKISTEKAAGAADGEDISLLKSAQAKTVEALNKTIDMLRSENKRKSDELANVGALKGEVVELRTEKEKLQEKLAAMSEGQSKDIEALQKELNEVQTEAGDSDEAKATIAALQKRLDDAIADKARLQEQLASVQGSLKAAETAETLQEEYEQLVAALRQENDILKDRINSLDPSSSEMEQRDIEASVAKPIHDMSDEGKRKAIADRLAEIKAEAGDDAFEIAQLLDEDLTEAQRYEKQLRGDLERDIEIQRVEKAEQAAPVVEAPAEVRASEDPFEDFGTIEQPDPFAAHDAAVEDAKAHMADEVEEFKIDEPVSAPEVVQEAQPEPAPKIAKSSLPGFANVLDSAGVAPASSVEMVEDVSSDTYAAYQWKSGSVFGSGEQKPLGNASQFDAEVKDYLTKTEERCDGDFAVIPDASKDVGGMRVDSYEIACVGKGVSSAASLVFYSSQGLFNALAHETSAENMEQAMQLRDKVFTSLIGGAKS